jgi:hypothetical protein
MKNRRAVVRFPVFNDYRVHVILSRDVRRTARRLGADDGPCLAFFLPGGKQGHLVLGPNALDPGTISHESSHAVRELLRFHGAKNDEETFAYHLDYLVGRIHKFLRDK